MMLALGLFVFSIGTAAYQSLDRQTSWRHASNSRVGARAGYQFVGVGEDTITLAGWIAPGQMGSMAALIMLRSMGDTGKSWTLVDGRGFFHGIYIIKRLQETHTIFNKNGSARKVEFTLNLERIDDNIVDKLLGDLKLPNMGSADNLASLL